MKDKKTNKAYNPDKMFENAINSKWFKRIAKKLKEAKKPVSFKLGGVTFGKDYQGLKSRNGGIRYYYQKGTGSKNMESDFGKFIVKVGGLVSSSDKNKVAKKLKEVKLTEKAERDYKDEYKKFQSSDKSKKYRAELNQYNRKKGTYGNGDGKDASHKGGKIVGFEKESTNRGRAEKSRLKKESSINEETYFDPKGEFKKYMDKTFKRAGIKVLKFNPMKQSFHNGAWGGFYTVKANHTGQMGATQKSDVLPIYINRVGEIELGIKSGGFHIGKAGSSQVLKNLKDFKKSDLGESVNEGVYEKDILDYLKKHQNDKEHPTDADLYAASFGMGPDSRGADSKELKAHIRATKRLEKQGKIVNLGGTGQFRLAIGKYKKESINEAKRYKLGDSWSKDFDYEGMLKWGMSVDWRMDEERLLLLHHSLEDVNYHNIATPLWDAMVALKTDNKSKAKSLLKKVNKLSKHEMSESINETKLTEDYKNSEWEVYVADENGKEKIVKKAKSKRAGVILYNKLINSDKYHEVGMRVVKESVNEANASTIKKKLLKQYGGVVIMKITKSQLREMIREEIQKLNESSLDYEQDFKWANENELKVISKLIWMNPQGIAGVIKMGKKKPAEFKKLIKQMAKKGLGESINEGGTGKLGKDESDDIRRYRIYQ